VRMRTLASVDPLTGLLNRDGLRRRLQRALAGRGQRGGLVGVLLIDVDRFRLINETLGQAWGDELLRLVANRIRSVTRSGDGLARLGGDQFAAHVGVSADAEVLKIMARNLQRAFLAPFELDGRKMVIRFSFGVAVADPQGVSVDALLQRAAQAVREAKRRGGNRLATHDGSGPNAEEASQRLEMEQRMHGALDGGQLFLVYQPIVDAASERVVMVEALLRWRDPATGIVSPTEFIPILEQTGLILRVGRWVLREACLQAARWPQRQPGGEALGMSVNLSPLQVAEPDFLEVVTAVLRETGLQPQRLQLEVTEGLLLDPTPDILRKIEGLLRLGVRLAVDDFGVGYSSLMYLKVFRLNMLKIDRAFIRDIARKHDDLVIARAMIDLGHGLGMKVTAEGVETAEQAEVLRRLGCDRLQGYFYGKPDTPEGVESLRAGRAATPAAPGGLTRGEAGSQVASRAGSASGCATAV
jgi:diguanylate cyclase (GGDEF)-like protein